MLYVKALASDTWLSAPLLPVAEQRLDKALVRALEHGCWGVNGKPVQVFPGLVVSYRDQAYSTWWLNQPHRAQRVIVDAGEVVAFHEHADALWFVEQGQAELVDEEEVKCLEQARAAAQGNVLDLSSAKGKRAVG
jgi:mannose-6-phosphate isomerase-like protein (cupin superfamily)